MTTCFKYAINFCSCRYGKELIAVGPEQVQMKLDILCNSGIDSTRILRRCDYFFKFIQLIVFDLIEELNPFLMQCCVSVYLKKNCLRVIRTCPSLLLTTEDCILNAVKALSSFFSSKQVQFTKKLEVTSFG